MDESISIVAPIYTKHERLQEELGALCGHLRSQGATFEILLLDNTIDSTLNTVVSEREHIKIIQTTGSSQQSAYVLVEHRRLIGELNK